MRKYLTNFQQLIYTLMISESYLTIEDMAKQIGVSKRSVNHYLHSLRTDDEYADFLKLVKTKKGIIMRATDHQKYQYMKEKLQIMFSESKNGSKRKSDNRTLDILIILLDSASYISIEKISEQIYYSKSSLNRNLSQIKKLLYGYHLELRSKPHYGIRIEGPEMFKRLLLTEIIEYKHKEDGIIDEYTNYSVFYQSSAKTRSDVKKILINTLAEQSFYIISNSCLKRLYKFLIISESRQKKGYTLQFEKNIQDELKRTRQWKAAGALLFALIKTGVILEGEEEHYGVAFFLLTNVQFNAENPSFLYDSFYEQAKIYSEKIIDRMQDEFHIDLRKMNSKGESLLVDFFTLVNIQMLLKTDSCNARLVMSQEKTDLSLSSFLAKWALSKLSEETGICFTENHCRKLTMIMKYFIDHYQYQHKLVRIALSTDYSYLENTEIKKEILKADYNGYIQDIDVVNFYQIWTTGYERKYDFIILDYPEAYYQQSEVTTINLSEIHYSYTELVNMIQKLTVDFKQILDDNEQDGIQIYEQKGAWKEIACNFLQRHLINLSEEEMNKFLGLKTYTLLSDEILVVFLPFIFCNKPIWEIIYTNFRLGSFHVSHVVFYSINLNLSLNYIKLINLLFGNLKDLIQYAKQENAISLSNEQLSDYIKFHVSIS